MLKAIELLEAQRAITWLNDVADKCQQAGESTGQQKALDGVKEIQDALLTAGHTLLPTGLTVAIGEIPKKEAYR